MGRRKRAVMMMMADTELSAYYVLGTVLSALHLLHQSYKWILLSPYYR